MKKLITIIALIIPSLLIGQETKEVIVKFPNSKQVREQYFVLKSNKNISQGEYIRYYKTSKQDKENKFVHSKGTFEKGKKNGMWEYFKTPSHGIQGIISKREFYTNGVKTGIWETYQYEKEGTVIERFDFGNNTPLEPIISVMVHYPNSAKEKGIQGKVELEYRLLNDCSIAEITVIVSLDPACDKEAIKSIKNFGILQKKYSVDKCQEKILKHSYTFKID